MRRHSSVTTDEGGVCRRCGVRFESKERVMEVWRRTHIRDKSGDVRVIRAKGRPILVSEFCSLCAVPLTMAMAGNCPHKDRLTIGLSGDRSQLYFLPTYQALGDRTFDHMEVEAFEDRDLLVTLMRARKKQRYRYNVTTHRVSPVAGRT